MPDRHIMRNTAARVSLMQHYSSHYSMVLLCDMKFTHSTRSDLVEKFRWALVHFFCPLSRARLSVKVVHSVCQLLMPHLLNTNLWSLQATLPWKPYRVTRWRLITSTRRRLLGRACRRLLSAQCRRRSYRTFARCSITKSFRT